MDLRTGLPEDDLTQGTYCSEVSSKGMKVDGPSKSRRS